MPEGYVDGVIEIRMAIAVIVTLHGKDYRMKKRRRRPIDFTFRTKMCKTRGKHILTKVQNQGKKTVMAEIVCCEYCGFVPIPDKLQRQGIQGRLIQDARTTLKLQCNHIALSN